MTVHGGDGVARTIALINQKGGVGKTTTAVNLAAGLSRLGRRVLLVDLDPQAHATLHVGADRGEPARTVYDLLLDPTLDAAPAVLRMESGLSVIPAETDLAAAEVELAQEEDRAHRLSRALAPLAREFEYVLIDCPPSLGNLTINGLVAAREVVIPMQAHFLGLQGVGKLLETVGLVAAGLNPRLRVTGLVLCMFESQTSHGQEVVSDIEGFLESARGSSSPWSRATILQPPIRRNIKLAECPSFGQTIFEYASTAAGAADYEALARTIDAMTVAAARPEVHVRVGERAALGSEA